MTFLSHQGVWMEQYNFKSTDQTATNSRVFCIYFMVFFKHVAFLICVMILPWYPVSVGTRVSPFYHDESWGCENLKTRLHHINIDTFDLPFWLIKPLQDSGGVSFEMKRKLGNNHKFIKKGSWRHTSSGSMKWLVRFVCKTPACLPEGASFWRCADWVLTRVGTSTKKEGHDSRFLVLETNKPKRGQSSTKIYIWRE